MADISAKLMRQSNETERLKEIAHLRKLRFFKKFQIRFGLKLTRMKNKYDLLNYYFFSIYILEALLTCRRYIAMEMMVDDN